MITRWLLWGGWSSIRAMKMSFPRAALLVGLFGLCTCEPSKQSPPPGVGQPPPVAAEIAKPPAPTPPDAAPTPAPANAPAETPPPDAAPSAAPSPGGDAPVGAAIQPAAAGAINAGSAVAMETVTGGGAAVALPAGWKGTGVLAKASPRPPKGAPAWAGIQAEVIARDNQRLLRAVGRADDIENGALGRTAAENRARAQLSRWLNQHTLEGSQVVNYWQRSKGHVHITQVEIPIPPDALK